MGHERTPADRGFLPDFVRNEYYTTPDKSSTTDDTVPTTCKNIVERIREDAEMQAQTLAQDYLELRGHQQALLEQCPLYTSSDSLSLNRYRDVIPYANNRVVLSGGLSNGYINASWVRQDGMSYIACQGPLERTSESFWLMVVEHGVPMIIMLTGLREGGRDKCHAYFPPQGCGEVLFGSVRVRCEHILEQDGIVERILSVSVVGHDGPPRCVKHYQLQTWPDHGVPDSPRAVYGILDILYRHHGGGDGITTSIPVVVHCSAGIGRTGVLIVLDILRARMSQLVHQQKNICDDDDNETNILRVVSIVQSIRKQRAGMVQTLAQLTFCIDTLVDMCNMILMQSTNNA